MTHQEIKVSDEAHGVRRITIDRPDKRNALTRPMMQALGDAVLEAEADLSVRVVLLDSTGQTFCAGADLDGLAGDPLTAEVDPGHRYLLALAAAEKPLVAAVQGGTVGMGVTMLPHFDLVFASPRASFRTPFIDLGLTPEGGSTVLFPAMMGRGRASVLLMLGEAVSAEQALAGGLVTEVVAPDALAGRAAGAAHALASKPPQALRLTKRMMGDADLLQIMEEEQAVFRSRLTTDEFREAVEALRRKIKTSAKHTAS